MKKRLVLGISLIVLVMMGLVLGVNYFDDEDIDMVMIVNIDEDVDVGGVGNIDIDEDLDMNMIGDIDEDVDMEGVENIDIDEDVDMNGVENMDIGGNGDMEDNGNGENINQRNDGKQNNFIRGFIGGFVDFIGAIGNGFCGIFMFLCVEDGGGEEEVACNSRSDCIDGGFLDPAPYCDANFRVMPQVFCFRPRTKEAYCGIHNAGRNRRECNPGFFCNEIDIDNNGIIDNVVCSRGVNCNDNGVCEYGEDMEKCVDCNPFDPEPPKPPGIPDPGPPFLPAPEPGPGPIPPDFSCKRSRDCSLPPTENAVSCEDRDGDGVNDELVRKRACCLGIGSNKQCNVCDRVSNCRYGCGWREDMNPPKTFCCTRNNPCNEPGCDGDGVCEDGEIPGICPDCPTCNHDGVCDRERGENFNNCVADCALAICCSDAECGERKYECDGNAVVWRTPRCKNICTNDAFCSESYAKISCPSGKTCKIGEDGKSGCVYF